LTAHAGIFSNVNDLSIWAGEWLRALHGESKIFPQALAEDYVRRQNIVAGSSRAIGWDTKSPRGTTAGKSFSPDSFGHTGFTGTSVWIDPEANLYVILLTNNVHPHRGDKRIQQVRRDVAEAAYQAVRGQP
jgi:CubicO group peptidase (beta-lactamase class C family)